MDLPYWTIIKKYIPDTYIPISRFRGEQMFGVLWNMIDKYHAPGHIFEGKMDPICFIFFEMTIMKGYRWKLDEFNDNMTYYQMFD